ncbi:MAG: rhodanese-like domain-containing protein [Brevinematia bacterium]
MKKMDVDVIIDLRSPREFEKDKNFYSSIGVEAVNLDFFKAPKDVESLDKDKSYYVICESGVFSDIITKIMKSKGFRKVKNIKGGIEELKKIVNGK